MRVCHRLLGIDVVLDLSHAGFKLIVHKSGLEVFPADGEDEVVVVKVAADRAAPTARVDVEHASFAIVWNDKGEQSPPEANLSTVVGHSDFDLMGTIDVSVVP